MNLRYLKALTGNCRNELPFYLVTHTSLVEADDEIYAARKAVTELRKGQQVKVAVKSDERTITHLVVGSSEDLSEVFNNDKSPDGPTISSQDSLEPVPDAPASQVDTKTSAWRIRLLVLSVGLGALITGTIIGLIV